MNKQYYVYVLTNKLHTVFYVGMTSNLSGRIFAHKNKLVEGFTKRYNVTKLVYHETFENKFNALSNERKLKRWKRGWKINYIREKNPKFQDLSDSIL